MGEKEIAGGGDGTKPDPRAGDGKGGDGKSPGGDGGKGGGPGPGPKPGDPWVDPMPPAPQAQQIITPKKKETGKARPIQFPRPRR